MPSQKGFSFIYILTIVLIFGLIAGAYYLGMQQSRKIEEVIVYPSVSPSSAVLPNQIPQAVPMQATPVGMNTYVNTLDKYSINYPSDYFILEPGFVLATPVSPAITILKGTPDQISSLTSGDNLEKYYYDSLSIYPQKNSCSDMKFGILTKSDIEVDNLEGWKWTGDSPTFADPYWGDIVIHIEKDSICYKFSFLRNPNNKEKSEELLNQFISSFKFTN